VIGLQALEPAQLRDQLGKAGPLDELHRVIRHVSERSDRVDRHDPRVLEPGHRLRLELEPLQRPRIHRRGQGEHLQRDPAAQRELLGLVDDPHAPPADLPEDAEVAEDPPPLDRALARRPERPLVAGPDDGSAEVGHLAQDRHQPADRPGPLRMTGRVVLGVDHITGLQALCDLFGQLG
jgi:hypothetical protein